MKKFRVTLDKIKETNYHFDRIYEISEKIKCENNFYKLFPLTKQFRYELNSFVNSYRSTTFNLQKECRTKYGQRFEEVYQSALQKIIDDDFLKIVKELRNINQKEGNLYPTFTFSSIKNGTKINFETDLNRLESSKILSLSSGKFDLPERGRFEDREDPKVENIIGTKEFKNKYLMSDDDIEQILKGVTESFFRNAQVFDENCEYKVHKIVIEKFKKEYTIEEFLENLRRVGKKLYSLYEEVESEL